MTREQALCVGDDEIADLLDGSLSDDDRATILAHVEACEECRHLLAVAAATTSAAGASAPPERAAALDVLRTGAAVSRFQILGLLGAGGMGIVYAAYDPELDRKVAIKLLWPGDPAAGELRRSRILREAQSMARLAHPNVVVVHDVGVVGDQVFVVMELVDGTTLGRWLAQGPRPWREVLEVFTRAGRGLAAAHAAGLVHRDFKPDNVLIGSDGQVRVTDFGLALAAEIAERADPRSAESAAGVPLAARITRSGTIAGTPAYMAPEQLAGETVDARSDVFSFCVALHEALFGERPFAGRTPREIGESIARGQVREPPGKARVPAWIRQALAQGLRAEPERRAGSMNELLAALGRDPGASRRRALGVAATVLVTAAAAIAAGGWLRSQRFVCKGAEARLAGVWDADRKAAVSGALRASGKPWAPQTWQIVEGALDAYTRDWVAMSTESCAATRITREQSEALLDLRMRCLDERLEEVRAVTEALSQPDEDTLGNAAKAARSISPLRGCADAEALQAPVPLPSDTGVRAEVERLRLELAKVKAQRGLGRYREGERRAAELAARARPLGYEPLLAEVLLTHGKFLDLVAEIPRAADALRDALWAAESGRDRKLAARILVELIWEVGHQQGEQKAGHEYARHAAALLRGLGGDVELEAHLAANEGGLLLDEGHPVEAEKLLRETVEKRRVVFGPEAVEYGIALVNLGVTVSRQGRHAEGLALSQRALGVYEKAIGKHHPQYGATLFNIADSLSDLGRLDEARATAEQALALLEETLGPEHVLVGSAENVLGRVANAQHRYAEAVIHLERAVALAVKLRGPDHVFVAHYASALSDALSGQGRHAEAIAMMRRALAIYARSGGNEGMSARCESVMAASLLATHEPAEARSALEHALAWQEPHETSPELLAVTRLRLAKVLVATGGDQERARRLAALAIEGYAAAGPVVQDDLEGARAFLSHLPPPP